LAEEVETAADEGEVDEEGEEEAEGLVEGEAVA